MIAGAGAVGKLPRSVDRGLARGGVYLGSVYSHTQPPPHRTLLTAWSLSDPIQPPISLSMF